MESGAVLVGTSKLGQQAQLAAAPATAAPDSLPQHVAKAVASFKDATAPDAEPTSAPAPAPTMTTAGRNGAQPPESQGFSQQRPSSQTRTPGWRRRRRQWGGAHGRRSRGGAPRWGPRSRPRLPPTAPLYSRAPPIASYFCLWPGWHHCRRRRYLEQVTASQPLVSAVRIVPAYVNLCIVHVGHQCAARAHD